MTNKPLGKLGSGKTLIAAVLLLSAVTAAQTTKPSPRRVIVSIPDRKLAVLDGGNVVRVFAVSVGAPSSPSPAGEFQIVTRIKNPTYYHPGAVIPAGSASPIGTRWVGLNKKSYGIHGTNEPRSIGKAASHGCIRLRNREMEQLFSLLRVGDRVEIRGERDQETAELFGTPPRSAAILAQSDPGAVRIARGR
jgi:lipoprotein-anchoring transpeptidase ErfK/SrfK